MSHDNRILIVDDMPSIHEDFRRILMPRRGSLPLAESETLIFGSSGTATVHFELDCASSGEDALELLKAALMVGRPYSLAFVDMRMPAGWDGVRTIEELWREDPQLQMVICTAYSDQPLEQALDRLGSQDRLLVLKKPFDPIEVSQIARALTAKRALALQSATHLANLEQLVREVQGAANELRFRNTELEALATTLSNDLRSPMKVVSMFSALLSQELRTHRGDKVANYLERLRVGAQCAEQLVEEVLSLTQISRSDLEPEVLDLSCLARELMTKQRAAHRSGQVSVSVQDGLCAWGDASLVRQLLTHLIDNAWKFTSGRDVATITFGANCDPNGELVFFVRDSGCGFDASSAGNLLTKLQLAPTSRQFAGAGGGLTAVGRIVERHGGRVWADSRPAHGTTVFFTLPNPVNPLAVVQQRAK